MTQCPGNTRLCVTCAYWDGKRTPNISFVKYDVNSVGKCYCIFPNGVNRVAQSSCNNWQKWSALRWYTQYIGYRHKINPWLCELVRFRIGSI